MIRIIDRNPSYSVTPQRYIVTCGRCESKFECDTTDFRRVIVCHGAAEPGVLCPVCGRWCTGWQGADKVIPVED